MARIVLVHGAFGRAANWDRVAPGLRAAGHEVEAIDLPGQGDDPTPVAEVTLDGYAPRVCEALASGPRAVLVGHSMGGVVITQAAARCPERIERAREGLMHCCDDEAAAWAASLRGTQPVAPFTHPVQIDGGEAFAGLPRAYVMCLQDRAIKPALQRLMLKRAGCDPVIEIDTDHSVWASRPNELVAALDRLAA